MSDNKGRLGEIKQCQQKGLGFSSFWVLGAALCGPVFVNMVEERKVLFLGWLVYQGC